MLVLVLNVQEGTRLCTGLVGEYTKSMMVLAFFIVDSATVDFLCMRLITEQTVSCVYCLSNSHLHKLCHNVIN